MDHKAFSVCLESLHLPVEDAGHILGAESLRLIRGMHRFFREKLVSSNNAFRTAELLDQSVFCCILPEGMVMLRCAADASERTIALDGFLVMQEHLRTAWQLSRWKLLFVCAAGWERMGQVCLTQGEIEQIAMSLKAPPALQAKLMDASRRMLAAPAPFSFAVTGYPLYELPVRFPGAADPEAAEAEQRGEILLLPEQAAALTARYQQDHSVLKSLRLHCGSRKQYQTLRQKNTAAFEDSMAIHKSVREELSAYAGEDIWYYSVQVRAELRYIRALRASASDKLCAGTIPFAELVTETDAFTDGLHKWLELLKQNPDPPPKHPDKPHDPPKGGFLRGLFSKK